MEGTRLLVDERASTDRPDPLDADRGVVPATVLARVLQRLPVAVAVLAPDERVLYAAGDLLPLPGRRDARAGAATLPARRLPDLLPPEILAAGDLSARLRRCAASGCALDPFQVRFRAPGVHRVYRLTLSPLHPAHDPSRTALLIVEDVTELTNLKRAHVRLRELHDTILASIPTAIAVLDSRGAVLFSNASFASLMDLPPGGSGAALGDPALAPLAALIHKRFGDLSGLLQELAVSDRSIRWDGLLGKDGPGGRCYVEAVARCLPGRDPDAETRDRLYLLTIYDISDRVRSLLLEEQMRSVDKLASLGEMMAGLAHEINNPLAVISGNAQFLCSTFGDRTLASLDSADWNEIVASLRSMDQESARCCKLVGGLLQLSHRAPADSEAPQRVYLNRLIADLLRVYEPQLRKQGIEVVRQLDRRAPQVAADPGELQQVFMNLLSNARHAMPDGGRLEITTEQAAGEAVARVSDSGPGIPPELLARVFEPFFTTKPVGQGTGLGLSIARSLVSRQGGSLEASNAPGRGACFIIRLPLAQEQG